MSRKGENIYKRKDGRWEGRYIKKYINGKARYGYVYAHSYKETKEKLLTAKAQITVQTQTVHSVLKNENSTFKEIAVEWITCNTSQLKQSSIVKYTNIIENYLVPEFAQYNIQEINKNDITNYISKLLICGGKNKQGLSSKTVNDIISVLKNIFEYATEIKGYTLINFKGLAVKQTQRTMHIFSLTEQKTICEYLTNHINHTNLGILICLYTGLRIGEICALKWEDISFEEQYINVHKTMQRLQTKSDNDKKTEIIISTPKSDCSVRNVPIPDILFSIMIEHKESSNTYILTGKENYYIEPRTMQNRFHKILKQCDIPSGNFHALRHTFATRCIELGFDIKSLSEILGHASVNITLNRYVHPSMELKHKNMNMLSVLLAVK